MQAIYCAGCGALEASRNNNCPSCGSSVTAVIESTADSLRFAYEMMRMRRPGTVRLEHFCWLAREAGAAASAVEELYGQVTRR